jgi:integrase
VTATLQRIDGELRFLEPKTPSARRSVSLPASVMDTLKTHRKEQMERRLLLGEAWHDLDLVVDRGDGAPFDPDSYTHWLRKAAAATGLPGVRFHDLRHAYATALLKQGVHPKIVSEALGHANVGFTLQVYSHVLPSMGGQAAEAIGAALNL